MRTEQEHKAEITRLTKEADDRILFEQRRAGRMFVRLVRMESATRNLIACCDRDKLAAGDALVQAKDALAGDDSALREIVERAAVAGAIAAATPGLKTVRFEAGQLDALVERVLKGEDR